MYKINEFRLSLVREGLTDVQQITNSEDSARLFREFAYQDGTIEIYESFYLLLLNRSNRPLGCIKISQGGVAGTVVDAKLVFSAALAQVGAASIILCHNHPSGNLNPTQADINLTEKLCKAAELLDFVILDHIILTESFYYSFADKGLI